MLARKLPVCNADCRNEEPNGFFVVQEPKVPAGRQGTRKCNTAKFDLHRSIETFQRALLVFWFSAACFFDHFCFAFFTSDHGKQVQFAQIKVYYSTAQRQLCYVALAIKRLYFSLSINSSNCLWWNCRGTGMMLRNTPHEASLTFTVTAAELYSQANTANSTATSCFRNVHHQSQCYFLPHSSL